MIRWMVAMVLIATVARAETGAKSVDDSWAKAMKANALDKLVELYATNAVAWFPGEAEAKGREAIRNSYAALLASNKVADVSLSDTHYRYADAFSVGWGNVAITIVEKATGKTNVWNARYTGVTQIRNGKWVYVIDHASAIPAEK